MPVAAWDVFWVRNCRHTRPVPKDKYVIIITANPKISGFLISSNPPRNLDPESEVALCYAGISRADTEPSFLRHNSFVGCEELFEFEEDELSRRMGIVLPNARQWINNAAQECPILPEEDRDKVNEAFASG